MAAINFHNLPTIMLMGQSFPFDGEQIFYAINIYLLCRKSIEEKYSILG